MHRDPVDTVASGASLNFTLWRLYADSVDPKEVGRQWLERMSWANARAEAARRRDPRLESRIVDVPYRSAVGDPLGEIERIEEAFGMPRLPDARRAMADWLARPRDDQASAHRYSPERFGLDDRTIRDAFADCPSRFDVS
jgi:hypothetical protein